MTLELATRHKLFKPALGAALTVAAGITLWALPMGEGWRLSSYDSLFRFATRHSTNNVAIVFMDNESFQRTGQIRSNAWDRARHAKLLNQFARDDCPLVVFDVFFEKPGEPAATLALVEAVSRFSNVVLAARQTNQFLQFGPGRRGIFSKWPRLLPDNFLDAVRQTNWGVGNVDTNRDGVVRQHWRFPSPGIYDSVAWTAAKLAGAHLSDDPKERWIRYYAPGWAWTSLSYVEAEALPTNYFHDKIVFIGNKPVDDLPNGEKDEFSTPFTDKTGGAVGGVEILATQFLNLINHEWLRRPPPWVEILVLVITGVLLGGGLCWRGRVLACVLAVGAAFTALVAGVWLSYFGNYWFPWLIVAGGQAPVALAFALVRHARTSSPIFSTIIVPIPVPEPPPPPPDAIEDQFVLSDYELVRPPIGKGAFGLVWLARNAVGQWQAVKSIHRSKFNGDVSPYEREFQGLQLYQSVSHNHPGLLRIDFVSRMRPEGYFYYVMELGDAVSPGWEQNPASYKALDLATKCGVNNGRLPVRECVRIGAKLCEPLQFLHAQGLAHRDIKPRNIIFVKGQPKLADIGLVAAAHRPDEEITGRGTLGFMPPDRHETPGTVQADIYALGITLYVISTGNKPDSFPGLATTLVDRNRHPGFDRLNEIFSKACQTDCALRYATVTEMHTALLEAEAALDRES